MANSNKTIADLQKQINALESDDSEENRKKLQQLKSDLANAQKDQEDLLYDRSISDQEKALDEMLENSQKQAEDYLSNSEVVFADALSYINTHTSQVASNIEKIARDTGYDVSTYITSAWEDSGDAVGDYASTLSSNVPNITAQIGLITAAWEAQTKAIEANAEAVKSATEKSYQEFSNVGTNGNSGNSNNTTDSKSKKLSEVDAYISKSLDKAKNKRSYYGSLNQYIYDITGGSVLSKSEEVALAKMLGVNVKSDLSGKNDRDNILKALRKLGWGQRVGTGSFSSVGFSTGGLINANRILKDSGEDGFALVKNGEYILSKEQTQAFLKLANVAPKLNLPDFNRNIPIKNGTTPMAVNIDNRVTVEGVATDQIVKDFEKVAQKQAENTVAKINSLAYSKGVRRR